MFHNCNKQFISIPSKIKSNSESFNLSKFEFLHFHRCVDELLLETDMSIEIELRFQYDRSNICVYRKTVDLLTRNQLFQCCPSAKQGLRKLAFLPQESGNTHNLDGFQVNDYIAIYHIYIGRKL